MSAELPATGPAEAAPAPAEAPAKPAEAAAEPAQPAAEPAQPAAGPAQAAAEPAQAAAGPAEAAPDTPAPPGGPADLPPAEVGAKLAELFPALFAGPPKPIKLRVHADIHARAPGLFSKKSLSIFFHRHTTSTGYLKALAAAPARLDLDGQPAGEIAEEHRSAATAELERRRAIVDAKRQAEREARKAQFKAQAIAEREQSKAARAEQQAQRAQQQAQREQRDAEWEARRERAALLRAFETSTLTKANFCALKGIPEAELDARLAQAREERAARPPRPDHAERGEGRPPQPGRGPRPPRPDVAPGGPPRKTGRARPPAR